MSIKQEIVNKLIEEIASQESIAGVSLESRFEMEPYKNDPNSELVFIGICYVEKRPEFVERDRHLLFAREAGLLRFETTLIEDVDDYVGKPIFVTPSGYARLEASRTKSLPALIERGLSYVFEHIGWPIAVGIVLILIALSFS